MKIILILVSIALLIFAVYLLYICIWTNHKLLQYFDKSSVIVYGAKGKGKDLIFQKIIYMKRKKAYYSNINYGYAYYKEPIRNLSVAPNTFKKFINNDIKVINKNPDYEGIDYYISDAGVFLPAQYNGELNKQYQSLPIYYALSRHLYNSNIHMNTQFLGRAWNMLREQADKFIKACGTIKIGGYIFVKCMFYERYETAMSNILPMKKPPLLNKYYKAQYEQYNSTYGEIKKGLFLIKTKHIRYDTRVFHNILFGETATNYNINVLISSLTKEEINKKKKLRARRTIKREFKRKYKKYLLLINDCKYWAKKQEYTKKILKDILNDLKKKKKEGKETYIKGVKQFEKEDKIDIDILHFYDV